MSDKNISKEEKNLKNETVDKNFLKNTTRENLGEIGETEDVEELKETRTALLNILEDTETARRLAEEEKNKTQAIITNFTDGLLVFDNENRLSLINPKARELLNVRDEEVINKAFSKLILLRNFKPIIELLEKEAEEIFRKEAIIQKNFILEISTAFIVREDEVVGKSIILHDITREKRIEEMKTEFVSIAAHQLRTPLSAIKWTMRMLLDGDVGDLSEEQIKFIERTYKSNERMIALINDLLNVTRIEEGRYLYELKPVDFVALIQGVIDSFDEEAKKRRLKLQFKKPAKGIPPLTVDPKRIELAIYNLIDNAIRYTPPGGSVTIVLKYDKKGVEFSIQDTGVGVPKDQQNRIFSKFFRGANVMRMETEGNGLGLFTTRNIIEAHKGSIWFKSEENKGTVFYFIIPYKGLSEKNQISNIK